MTSPRCDICAAPSDWHCPLCGADLCAECLARESHNCVDDADAEEDET